MLAVDQLEARGGRAVLTYVGAAVGIGAQHERERSASPLEVARVECVQRTEQAAPVQECGEVVELVEHARPAVLVERRAPRCRGVVLEQYPRSRLGQRGPPRTGK